MSADTPFEASAFELAKGYGTATIYEALKIDTIVDPAIRTVWRGAKLAAPAYTVQCSPGDNLAIHVAMERAPRGSVLVVDGGGFIAGYWGEVLTVAAETAGLVGLVIDGGVRDIEAITAHGFPTFARGISIRGTVKASVPGVGKAIRIGGCPVASGDIVVADDDGIVVVPALRFTEALQKSRARVDNELEMMNRLRAGVSSLEQIKMTHWRDK